jgi:hypothetical protein
MLKKVGFSLKSPGNAHSSLTTDIRPAKSLVAKLFLVSLFGTLAFGQLHGSSVSGGNAPNRSRGATPATRPAHPLAPPLPAPNASRRVIYPYAFSAFVAGYDREYSAQPDAVVQQSAPQVTVQEPPLVARPEMHVYAIPGDITFSAEKRGHEAAFVIALANGSRYSANAVWVQNGFLYYVDREDQEHQVPLNSVDSQLTRQLNRENNLAFWLPDAATA